MTAANRLKRNDIIRDDTNRYWEIMDTQHQKMARKGGLVTVDLVEIPSGKKQQRKLKSNVDELDVVDAPMIDFIVHRLVDKDGDTVDSLPAGATGVGMDLTMEGVEAQYGQKVSIPVDKFLGTETWHDLRFLMGDMSTRRSGESDDSDESDESDDDDSDDSDYDDDDDYDDSDEETSSVRLLVRFDNDREVPISVIFPDRFECTVGHSEGTNMNLNDNWKRVTLTNGVSLRVPGFIGEGDRIVVNARDKTYVEKAST